MERLPHGGDYIFISLLTLQAVPTHDWHFQTDDEKWEERNYFTDGPTARACLSEIQERWGGDLEKIEEKNNGIKQDLITTIAGLVMKATNGGEKTKAGKEIPKVTDTEIVQDLVLAYGTFKDKRAELSAKKRGIHKEIKAYIKNFNKNL